MSCYAYKDEEVEQTLEDHLRGTLNVLREECRDYFNDYEVNALQELKIFAKVLSSRLGVDAEEIEELIKFAVLVHDIGKIDEEFQIRCQKICKSFPAHYRISARILYEALQRAMEYEVDGSELMKFLTEERLNGIADIGKKGITYRFVVFALLPVLLHHYAQIGSERSLCKGQVNLKVWKPCINVIERVLSNMRWKKAHYLVIIGKEIIEVIKSSEDERRPLGPTPFDRDKKPCDIESPSFSPLARFLIDSVIGLVNMVDGIDAVRVRRYRRVDHIRC